MRESHQLQLELQEKLKTLPGPDKQLVDGETTDTSNTTTKEEKKMSISKKALRKGFGNGYLVKV